MSVSGKLSADGNSWAVRLPKAAIQISGFKAGQQLSLEVAPGRVVIRPSRGKGSPAGDRFKQAKQDAKQAWAQAFEQAWLEMFGVDE